MDLSAYVKSVVDPAQRLTDIADVSASWPLYLQSFLRFDLRLNAWT